MKKREKFVLTCPMVLGIDGKTMSKTSNNCIWLKDSPTQMFGKIMSIPDSLIFPYFELLTTVSLGEIQRDKKVFEKEKVNPRDLKKKLAFEIVKLYYSLGIAQKEKKEFEKSYHSFVDVFTDLSFKRCYKYIIKYISKNYYYTKDPEKVKERELTLAYCWLYSKHSFAISGDLIKLMSKSNFLLSKSEEELGKNILDIKYDFLGIFLPEEFDYSSDLIGPSHHSDARVCIQVLGEVMPHIGGVIHQQYTNRTPHDLLQRFLQSGDQLVWCHRLDQEILRPQVDSPSGS